jgi:ammonium transporter, Amt family
MSIARPSWYGFNAGSVYYITVKSNAVLAQNAVVNTTLSAAAGCISALLAKAWLSERQTGEATFSLTDALWGCISGLVSVTGGCAIIQSWASIVIGLVSGLIYLCGSNLLVKLRIDDAVDAIPIHLFCGIWGAISVGLFAVPEYVQLLHPGTTAAGWFYQINDGRLLACQVIGVFFVVGWVTILMFPFFGLLHYMGWLRADSLDEIVGLDISYHGARMMLDNITEESSSHDQHFAEHYERRQQQREENRKRGNLRRRMLLLDLSSSKSRRQQAGGENASGIEEGTGEGILE